MTLVFTLMLEMLLFLRAGAQSVTQPDDHITVSEGARLELKCNYSSSFSPYLFWCERDGCGAESPSPESPGGSQLYSAV
ncbi:hypothetical protein AB1E18_008145 [Capra hircus]